MKIILVMMIFLLSCSLVSAISVDDFSLADLGFTGFVVEANLDTSGTAQVLYGKTGALGSATNLVSSSSEHLLQVDGLQENTVYFYRVVGKDSSGNSYSSAISLTRTPGNGGSFDNNPPSNSADTIILNKLKAFPSAQGHGADTIVGGKGGKIFYVTSLANTDSGKWNSAKGVYEGTLRYAMRHDDAGYIIFRTAGVAKFSGYTDYNFGGKGDGHKTIIGASAPYPGVTLNGMQTRIQNTEGNWIIRGLTFLGGSTLEKGIHDALVVKWTKDVIVSDNTFGWGADESYSVGSQNGDFVVQRNLAIEGMPGHNVGSIFGTERDVDEIRGGSAHNNGYIHVTHRFPNFRGLDRDNFDNINQFAYNFGTRMNSHSYQVRVNDINNYYKAGPKSASRAVNKWNAGGSSNPLWKPEPRIYTAGNIITNYFTDPDADNRVIWNQHVSSQGFTRGDPLPNSFFVSKPFPIGLDIQVKTAKEAYDYNIVGKNIGARYYTNSNGERVKYIPPFIDAYFEDAIQGTDKAFRKDNNKFVLPSIPSPRSAYVDSDYDGMPDEWEKKHGLNVGVKDHEGVKRTWVIDGATFDNSAGFTNMQMFDDYVHGGFLHLIYENNLEPGSSIPPITSPTTSPTSDTSFGISGFYLNQGASSTKNVGALSNGMTLDISNYPDDVTISAKSFGDVKSVLWFVNNKYQKTENTAPWNLYEDFDEWATPGSYLITAVPYNQASQKANPLGTGTQGESRSIIVTVVDGGNTNPTSTTSPDTSTNNPSVGTGKLKAFPSAYGGGSEVTGGRGGVLYIVDTLDFDVPAKYHPKSGSRDAYYTGGFEDAIEDKKIGPRYIVFDVSGNIYGTGATDPNQNLKVYGAESYTIFGQSAPRGGITLYKASLTMADNSKNIIVRYMRSRPGIIQGNPIGDDQRTTPIAVSGPGVIIDHFSASWGGDKAIIAGCWKYCPNKDITVQNSIMADSATLGFSNHGAGNEGRKDAAGEVPLGGQVSWFYNFFAGPSHRTPNIGGFDGYGEVQNNVVQNKATRFSRTYIGTFKLNYVGNWLRTYNSDSVKNEYTNSDKRPIRVHAANNYYQTNSGVKLRGNSGESNRILWEIKTSSGDKPLPSEYFSSSSFYGKIRNPAPLLTAQQAKEKVLSDVGANKYLDNDGRVQRYQDSYDTAALQNLEDDVMKFRKNSADWKLPIIPTSKRPSNYDTDKDGMSDAWERRTFGNLDQSYRGDHDGDGYTNIEEYMNQVDYE